MESRTFIILAATLQRRIADMRLAELTNIQPEQDSRQGIQKDLAAAFMGLQNPTLPSAYKLRDAAQDAGYFVDPRIQQLLHKADSMWS